MDEDYLLHNKVGSWESINLEIHWPVYGHKQDMFQFLSYWYFDSICHSRSRLPFLNVLFWDSGFPLTSVLFLCLICCLMLSSSNLGPRPVAPCLPFSWFSFSPMPLASVATHLQVISPLYLQLSPPLGSRSIRSIDPSIQLLINVSWKFSRHLKCSILTPNSSSSSSPVSCAPCRNSATSTLV